MTTGTEIIIDHQITQAQIISSGLNILVGSNETTEIIIGIPGPEGSPGVDGNDGSPGAKGDSGADGVGIPVGGSLGQVLAKQSGVDFDTDWQDQTSGSGSSNAIVDIDGDTKVDVEGTSDDDFIRFHSAGNQNVVINPQGYLAVGRVQSTGMRPLHAETSGQTFIRVQGAGTVGMEFNSNGTIQQAFSLDTANNLIFRNTTGSHSGSLYFDYKVNTFFRAGGVSKVMTLTSSQNVGIGKSNPSAKLDVDGTVRIGSYTISTLPSASIHGAGSLIYISDEAGGATIAFSDGTNWRRMSDRTIVS